MVETEMIGALWRYYKSHQDAKVAVTPEKFAFAMAEANKAEAEMAVLLKGAGTWWERLLAGKFCGWPSSECHFEHPEARGKRCKTCGGDGKVSVMFPVNQYGDAEER